MDGEKRIVPGWMRTTAKIGLVIFPLLAVTQVLVRNWPAFGAMVVFTVVQVNLLMTTKSREN
ncbi:MAG: hypothetical protein K0R39_2860 [Symbiobacteriaceae bacterium]|jgi:hypothetical protein|nr:hypothetical protein [Symbiobacteriaceae bacterium]